MGYFNFTTKIAAIKDSDKFHPISRNDYSSGWTNTTVNFNCVSGMNRIGARIQGGKWIDDKKNAIKTFSKNTTDASGKVTKGSMIEIPWDERFDEDQIERVAGFRKCVFDDKEFLSTWDFAEYVAEVMGGDEYKDKLFNVSGTYEIQYNSEKDTFYRTYQVSRIYTAREDAVEKTDMTIEFFFNEDSWDDGSIDETGKVYVNGWTDYYDGGVKAKGFCPITVVVEKDKAKALKRKFNVNNGIKQISLLLTVIEGTERKEITLDMLDDEVREDIEAGLLDFEKVKREMNGSVAGDFVREFRFKELGNSKGAQDTMYSTDDMHPAGAVMDIFDGVEDDEDNF